MTEPHAYLRGSFVPVSQLLLPVFDSGIVSGATVSQTLRTFRHQPFRLEEHLARLFRSLEYMGLKIEPSPAQLATIVRQVVEHNARLIAEGDDLAIVIFVTAGAYATYAPPHAEPVPTLCVHNSALPFRLWADKVADGQHLVTTTVRHVPPECVDPAVKNRSRLTFYLADLDARRTDPKATALLLDQAGNLTETGTANFFLVRGQTLLTPRRECILPGVSRQTTIELAGNLGIRVVECDLNPDDVLVCDEAFTTSTPYCLLPVTRFNGQRIGRAERAVFPRLVSAWNDLVGLDIHAQILNRARKG